MARKKKQVAAPNTTAGLDELTGIDPTQEKTYTGFGFCCPDCGSLNLLEHSYTCRAAVQAGEAGADLVDYAKNPDLWCPEVSGHEDDEQVRCVGSGKPLHEGIHHFPTRKTAIELQHFLKAVEKSKTQLQEKYKPRKFIPQGESDMAKAKAAAVEAKTETKKNGKKGNPDALKKAQEAAEGKRAEIHAKKIHLLTKDNPKREGTAAHKRFSLYKNNMTVGDALAAGVTMSDIRYNEEHGHLELK